MERKISTGTVMALVLKRQSGISKTWLTTIGKICRRSDAEKTTENGHTRLKTDHF